MKTFYLVNNDVTVNLALVKALRMSPTSGRCYVHFTIPTTEQKWQDTERVEIAEEDYHHLLTLRLTAAMLVNETKQDR